MEDAHERRSEMAPRIPLDVLVSLAHPGLDEVFEADAVDVSPGGLSMRAAYLPEVGARLACRFELPLTAEPLEAEAEVVWAADSGERIGQFGVRFVDLEPRAEAALRALAGRAAGPAPDSEGRGTGRLARGAPAARLYLDGVRTPIVARVAHRADDLLTVEQDLPFLRLDKGLTLHDDEGRERRARIGSVDLELVGDMPRLVLQVVFESALAERRAADDAASAAPSVADDRTEPDLVAPSHVVADAPPGAAAHEGRGAAETGREDRVPPPMATRADEAHTRDATGRSDRPAARLEVPDAVEAALARHRARRAVEPEHQGASSGTEDRTQRAETGAGVVGLGTLGWRARRHAAAAGAALLPLLLRARTWLVALVARGRPFALRLAVWARALLVRLRPALSAALDRGRAVGGRLIKIARARANNEVSPPASGAKATRPRRTTTPAPGRATPPARVAEAAPEPARAPTRPVGRYVLLALLSGLGLVLGAYALGDGEHGTGTVPTASPAPAPFGEVGEAAASSPDVGATGVDALAVAARSERAAPAGERPAVEGRGGPPTPATSAVAQNAGAAAPLAPAHAALAAYTAPPPTPTALPAPSYAAGHLPPPTYPSLPSAPRPQAAGGLPPTSPYALDVRPEAVAGREPTPAPRAAGTASPAVRAAGSSAVQPSGSSASSFGAATVPGGRSFLLRMTQPVSGLSGRRDPKGFDVRIDGALTLDRAAPIAAAHPLVETAMIINRGDHADLSIRFRDGRIPAYRVVARGAAVEVILGR